MTKCKGPKCDRDAVAKGLCNSHYHQQRKGNPLTALKPYRPRPKDAPAGHAFCNVCERYKPIDEFPKTDKGKPRYLCKPCFNIYQKERARRVNNA